MNMLNNWITYVILYVILMTVFTQFYKVSTKSLKSAGALTMILQILGGLTVLLLLPFFEFKLPTDPKIYMVFGLAIIFYAISDRVNTTVRSGIEASTFSILQQLSTTFMTIAGFIFFKEEFIWTKFIGALLIIFSNVLIFYKKGKFEFNKYIVYGILSNISFTIALFLDVNISNNFTLPLYVALSLMVPSILVALIERIKLSEIKNEFVNGNKPAIIITAICWGTAIITQLKAYQVGDVTVVTPLCALAVILNVIVGYLFQKERDDIPKKVISAILIILGVILINVKF